MRLPRPLAAVAPGPEELSRRLPGDELLPGADVVMDRAFTVPAPPEAVWPWLVQLGKRRAGWYLPRSVERWVPPGRRGARQLVPRWQDLAPGDVVPDYGGRDATFTAAVVDGPDALVYTSRRRHTDLTWALVLRRTEDGRGTRVQLRLRLGPVRHTRLAEHLGGAFDLLTVAGLASGLRERVDRP